MIGLQDVELKQTRFYQDVFREGVQKGIQEGTQRGELKIVLGLLEERFGQPPDTLVSSLRQIESEHLETFSRLIVKAQSVEELEQWLEQSPQAQRAITPVAPEV